MKNIIYIAIAAGLILPCVRADDWNKKMAVTVKQSVEVPGKVLEPGDYIFRLQDSQSNRNVVQIYDKDESKLLQTVHAFPNYRLIPRRGVTIQLEERPVGQPEAIHAIFFPGDNYGQEFVYPPAEAKTAIAVTQQPIVVAAAPPPPRPAAPPQEAHREAPPPAPPAEAPPPAPAPAPEAPPPMPQTGSELPLAAMIGAATMGAALGLRMLRRA